MAQINEAYETLSSPGQSYARRQAPSLVFSGAASLTSCLAPRQSFERDSTTGTTRTIPWPTPAAEVAAHSRETLSEGTHSGVEGDNSTSSKVDFQVVGGRSSIGARRWSGVTCCNFDARSDRRAEEYRCANVTNVREGISDRSHSRGRTKTVEILACDSCGFSFNSSLRNLLSCSHLTKRKFSPVKMLGRRFACRWVQFSYDVQNDASHD